MGPSLGTALSICPRPRAAPRRPPTASPALWRPAHAPRCALTQPGLTAMPRTVLTPPGLPKAGLSAWPAAAAATSPGGTCCPCVAVIRQDEICAVWGALLPPLERQCAGLPCHHRSCQRPSDKDVSECGRHGVAAGVWADVLSPRARARPAKERPDTPLVVEDALAPVRDLLPRVPPGHRRTRLPRCTVLQVAQFRWNQLLLRLLRHCCAAGLQPCPLGCRGCAGYIQAASVEGRRGRAPWAEINAMGFYTRRLAGVCTRLVGDMAFIPAGGAVRWCAACAPAAFDRTYTDRSCFRSYLHWFIRHHTTSGNSNGVHLQLTRLCSQ